MARWRLRNSDVFGVTYNAARLGLSPADTHDLTLAAPSACAHLLRLRVLHWLLNFHNHSVLSQVVCSNTLNEERLKGDDPEFWPERRYMWGTSQGMNPEHSDLLLLRRLLLTEGVEEIATSKVSRCGLLADRLLVGWFALCTAASSLHGCLG